MNNRFRVAILSLGLALSATAMAAPAADKTLRNGRSVYGVPSTAQAADRVVDVASAKALNIDCYETVTFRSGQQEFTWKFEVVGHGAVALKDIAPAGFDTKGLKVYIAPSDAERN